MSTSNNVLEAENNPEQYDELCEDWFSDADYDLSFCRFRIVPPGYLVIKRKTYSHWEKDVLKDEVVVKLHGRSDKEKALEDSKTKSSADPSQPFTADASRIRTNASAALDAPPAGQPNNAHNRAQASVHVNAHGHLYAPSPNQRTSFTSSTLPHLPLATQFPPLDARARAQSLASSSSHRAPASGFARFQIMVADSVSRSSISESSTLRHLAGLHNQVQGSSQSPLLWQLPYKSDPEGRDDSSNSSSSEGQVGDVDSSSLSVKGDGDNHDSIFEGLKVGTLAGLQSIGYALEDAFNPRSRSPTLSDLGSHWRSRYDLAASSFGPGPGSGFASGSECTCGHQRHSVRPLQHANSDDELEGDDEDSEDHKDFSFYFRSRTESRASRHGSANLEENDSADHAYNHTGTRQAILADTLSAVQNFAGSERSKHRNARANRSVTSISQYVPPYRRSPFDVGPSPWFYIPGLDDEPDNNTEPPHDHVKADVNEQGEDDDGDVNEHREDYDETVVEHSHHRVYFAEPQVQQVQPIQPASSGYGNSTLRNLFAATRRRVSSFSGSAFSLTSKKQSGSDSRPGYRSTPSAKEELEKGERKVSDAKGKQEQRRVLLKRGRSSTVRSRESSRKVYPTDTTATSSENRGQEQELGISRPPLSKKEGSLSGRLNFIRRIFLHLGPGNEHDKATEESPQESSGDTAPSNSSPLPKSDLPQAEESEVQSMPIPEQREVDIKSRLQCIETEAEEKRPRFQSSTGPLLFRNLSLASPRTPGSARRWSTSGTGRDYIDLSRDA